MAKTRTAEQELRDSRSEVKEFREMLSRKSEQAIKLGDQVREDRLMRRAMFDRCVQERTECIARMYRIEMRIRALGFLVPSVPGDPPNSAQ